MGSIDLAALMAICIDAIYISITTLSFRLECMSVGLHDVKLWAQMASRIIQSVRIAELKWVSPVIQSWHANDRDRGHAAATHITQVNIVFYGTSKKIWTVVLTGVQS